MPHFSVGARSLAKGLPEAHLLFFFFFSFLWLLQFSYSHRFAASAKSLLEMEPICINSKVCHLILVTWLSVFLKFIYSSIFSLIFLLVLSSQIRHKKELALPSELCDPPVKNHLAVCSAPLCTHTYKSAHTLTHPGSFLCAIFHLIWEATVVLT